MIRCAVFLTAALWTVAAEAQEPAAESLVLSELLADGFEIVAASGDTLTLQRDVIVFQCPPEPGACREATSSGYAAPETRRRSALGREESVLNAHFGCVVALPALRAALRDAAADAEYDDEAAAWALIDRTGLEEINGGAFFNGAADGCTERDAEIAFREFRAQTAFEAEHAIVFALSQQGCEGPLNAGSDGVLRNVIGRFPTAAIDEALRRLDTRGAIDIEADGQRNLVRFGGGACPQYASIEEVAAASRNALSDVDRAIGDALDAAPCVFDRSAIEEEAARNATADALAVRVALIDWFESGAYYVTPPGYALRLDDADCLEIEIGGDAHYEAIEALYARREQLIAPLITDLTLEENCETPIATFESAARLAARHLDANEFDEVIGEALFSMKLVERDASYAAGACLNVDAVSQLYDDALAEQECAFSLDAFEAEVRRRASEMDGYEHNIVEGVIYFRRWDGTIGIVGGDVARRSGGEC